MTDSLSTEFGGLVRRIRKDRSLHQLDIAQSTGFSRVAVANIEAGRQSVGLRHLSCFAKALGVSPVDLLPSQLLNVDPSVSQGLLSEIHELKVLLREKEETIVAQARVISRIERQIVRWRNS